MIRSAPQPVSWTATIALVCAAAFSGCTHVETSTLRQGAVTMTQAQFAAYVERVFRHHNKVMNDLINAAGELPDEGDDSDMLSSAEEVMNEACEPLNEVASAEAVSQPASFWTTRKLPEAVPACEAATLRLERLLNDAFKTRRTLDLTDCPPAGVE